MKTQTFGIEIETTGFGRQGTAEAIARFFGTRAQYIGAHHNDWKVPMPDGRKWTIESDSLVTNPSAEVVRAIRKAGTKVNETCGIHIHVGLGSHTPRTLRNLVSIVMPRKIF